MKEDSGWIRLSSRFIAEMEPYLKEVHGNEIADCRLCKKTVIRVSLPGKKGSFHIEEMLPYAGNWHHSIAASFMSRPMLRFKPLAVRTYF